MSAVKAAVKTDLKSDLDETNFRSFAKKAIESYQKKGMLVDVLLWGGIIREYELALDKAGVTSGKEPLT